MSMLSDSNKRFMLSVVMLNVAMLSVDVLARILALFSLTFLRLFLAWV